MTRSRGAALPETAVILGVTLTLIFGTVELGLIGLTQLSSDGGAFIAAHTAVFGGDADSAVTQRFPNLAGHTTTIATAANQPDVTDDPVWGDPVNTPSLTNPNDRHGGVQIVRPTHQQATIANSSQGVDFGSFISFANAQIGSSAIEGNMMVSNKSLDVYSYTLNSAASLSDQIDYFSDDGNAPPYFIGFKEGQVCTSVAVAQGCSQIDMRSFSSAEYLDANNWAQPNDGIGANGVYAAMLLHQHVYANIASELDGIYANIQGGTYATTYLDPSSDACVQAFMSWEIAIPGSTGWDWHAYPLNPLGGQGGSCD